MRKYDVRTPEQALVYITDCNLATVEHMATIKSRKKGEFERQISIAQTSCDWIERMNINFQGTRVEEIIGKQTVKEWSLKIIEKWIK